MGAWGSNQGALSTPPFCSGTHWSPWGWGAVSREQCLQLKTKAMAAVRLARQARVVEPGQSGRAGPQVVSCHTHGQSPPEECPGEAGRDGLMAGVLLDLVSHPYSTGIHFLSSL